VPFGDSVFVRNFLHVTGKVQSPESMHPKRPILGLTCPRREVFHYPFSSLPFLVINDSRCTQGYGKQCLTCHIVTAGHTVCLMS
jgi:hypothetical protein